MTGGYLLAGDVGGTKTTLAIARAPADSAIVVRQVYASREFNGLEAVLADFLGRSDVAPYAKEIGAACFSVAGPVSGNVCALTNLDWKADGAALARAFGFPISLLINDFAAAGLGIALLEAPDFETLQDGDPEPCGARLVIGAGTGLGVGLLVWTEGGYVVQPSEAGHADFAPVDELQDQLLVCLRRTFGRVSCERVVSGPGLMRIFSFLQDSGAGMPSRQLLDAARQRGDLAEVIAEYAMARLDPLAVRALELFVAAYGAFAGNLALVTLARGGVFIAGGIAPKIVVALREGGFMRAFTGKGRFGALLAGMPVRVVMNPNVCLLGALAQADRLRR